MSITNKTRKILWAKSGGKCAICRIDLAHSDSDEESNHVFGEECHIISSKPTGPRFVANINYDSSDNLILLCPNHHSLIDKKIEKYPVDELRKIKIAHEKWVSENLSKKKDQENDISHLQRLTTGREIVDIIMNNHVYEFNYDEVKTKEESDYVGCFFQELKDYGECSDLMEISERVEFGFKLNKSLEELDEKGFWVFGARRKKRMFADITKESYLLNIATIRVVKKDNPEIITPDIINEVQNALKEAQK